MNFLEKVGLQLYTVRDEAKKDFLGTLEKVATIGYRAVEFAGFFDTPAEVLKETLERLSLMPISSHTSAELLRNDIENVIKYNKLIGTKHIVLPLTKVESLDELKGTAALLNNIAPRIHDAGMELGYHNHDKEFTKFNGEYAMDILLDLTQKAEVFPQFDVFWIQFAGLDPIDWISKYGSRCKIIHLKDMKTKGERENIEVGNGVVDMKAVIAKGLEVGAEYFIVEQDNFDKPSLESCSISFNNIKTFAEQINI